MHNLLHKSFPVPVAMQSTDNQGGWIDSANNMPYFPVQNQIDSNTAVQPVAMQYANNNAQPFPAQSTNNQVASRRNMHQAFANLLSQCMSPTIQTYILECTQNLHSQYDTKINSIKPKMKLQWQHKQ